MRFPTLSGRAWSSRPTSRSCTRWTPARSARGRRPHASARRSSRRARAERDRLGRRIDEARAAQSALAKRRADEVDAPLEGLAGQLNAHRDVLVDAIRRLQLDADANYEVGVDGSAAVDAIRRLQLDADVPAAVSVRDAAALQSHIGAPRGRHRGAVERRGRARARRRRRADAARRQLAALGERLDPDIDVRDLDAIVDGVRAKAEEARFDERRARRAADDFAAIIEDVQRLRTLLAEVEEKERALDDLEDALKPGAFLKWLTLRRSRRLLVHASRMLGEISGGKYAFVDPRRRRRAVAGSRRRLRPGPAPPASLSGGEQFIASLSLALGMVEMMARGGGRLESLFLDEGFGSLDRNNLDAAVQALGTVAAAGRMVGVISSRPRGGRADRARARGHPRGPPAPAPSGSRAGKASGSPSRTPVLEAASALAGLLE